MSVSIVNLPFNRVLPAAPTTIAAGLVFFIAFIITGLYRRDSTKANFEHYQWDTEVSGTAKKRWMWDSVNLLREGYFKFYDKPWQVWTSEGYHVVLPPAYVDELKMLPDHTFPSSLREFMLPQYTFKPFAPWKLDYVNHVIRYDLNKNMAKIFPSICEEVDIALPIEFPGSTDWSEVDISTQLLRIVCRISGRAFVGTGLHRNEEWINISCNYTKDVFLSALKLRAVPSFLRPFAAAILPDLKRVYRHNERACALVQPILQQREQDSETVSGYVKPNDTIQWIHDLIAEEDKHDYAYQGAAQLAITAVSVQTTSKLIVNVILNLMTYVEYVPVLKEEIETVLAKCGGKWTLESMNQLEKLDSFMRESLRFEPPLSDTAAEKKDLSIATFQRRAANTVTLSDGTSLVQGTLVLAPASGISSDPSFYPEPDRFDGLRFYNLRQEADDRDKARQQFVATNKTQLQFGLGRHVCPGRWFAGHVIKMVVASVLLNYDLKFRDGEKKLKAFLFQSTNMPNPKTRILMRRKTGED